MNVSAALLISALAVSGDPCAPACSSSCDPCEKPGLLARIKAKLNKPSCTPCGTPLFAGCAKNDCDPCAKPSLLDRLKAKLASHKSHKCDDTCTPACHAPAPTCAPACHAPAPTCCEDPCAKPSILDRIKARLHSRKNKCCEPACTTECCGAAPAHAAPAAPAAPATPKAMPKPADSPKPMEQGKPKTAALINGFVVPQLSTN